MARKTAAPLTKEELASIKTLRRVCKERIARSKNEPGGLNGSVSCVDGFQNFRDALKAAVTDTKAALKAAGESSKGVTRFGFFSIANRLNEYRRFDDIADGEPALMFEGDHAEVMAALPVHLARLIKENNATLAAHPFVARVEAIRARHNRLPKILNELDAIELMAVAGENVREALKKLALELA